MSGKLDQSLDEIMKDRKPAGGARRGRKVVTKAKPGKAVAAPAAGIQKKSAKLVKPVKAPVLPISGDSKIAVSNLPEDVTEALIKDYFGSTIAPVKRVILNYGPNGRSRGSATVLFSKPNAAAEAAKLDGTRVDGRPLKIEVLVGAKNIPAPDAPKPLKDRVAAKPKNATQEKSKTAAKPNAKADAGKAKTASKKKSGRAGRPKAKTAEELDAEMQDYFGAGGESNGVAPAGTAAPAVTNGDTGMEDEVM